ncbi:MAG: ATP-binding protein [Opitutaceae bacterium]
MLRIRLFFGLLPLLLLLVAIGGYAIHVCRDMAESLSRDLIGNYQSAIGCEQLRTAATLMTNALAPAILADAERRAFDEQRAAFKRELMAQAAAAAGTARNDFLAAVDDAFVVLAVEGARQLERGGSAAAGAGWRAANAALIGVLQRIEALAKQDFAVAQQAAKQVRRLATTTERVMLATIAVGVALSILLAWALAVSLLRPIRALTESAIALGDGDLQGKVPESTRDELGQLGRAFNTMAAKLRAYREATVAKVLRTQRTMEATLTSAPDPVFVVGRDGVTEIRNPAAEALGDAALPPSIAEVVTRVLETGEHYLPSDYGRAIALRVGRDDRHYLPRVLAIGDQLTEFKGAAVILQDVTKFRLLDDAKTNLVGTVSHELKTPLTSLRLAVYLLLEQNIRGLSATQRELLESARDDADRLLRILDNLLDLARLEAGASTLDRRDVEIGTLLGDIVRESRAFIEPAGQTLVVKTVSALEETRLKLDSERIRHVFMNLLTNASKYSPAGGEILLEATAAEAGFVKFSVRDRGPGIPASSVTRVFDRFYRAPEQEKKGAGLGLAIAREIVVAHGGSIACHSVVGEGAEFYFLLPR